MDWPLHSVVQISCTLPSIREACSRSGSKFHALFLLSGKPAAEVGPNFMHSSFYQGSLQQKWVQISCTLPSIREACSRSGSKFHALFLLSGKPAAEVGPNFMHSSFYQGSLQQKWVQISCTLPFIREACSRIGSKFHALFLLSGKPAAEVGPNFMHSSFYQGSLQQKWVQISCTLPSIREACSRSGSKFHALFLLSGKPAAEVGPNLQIKVFAFLGTLQNFHSDNSSEFVNEIIRN